MQTKWILLTFGAGSNGYRESAKRLAKQAVETKMFDSALAFDERELAARYPEFWNENEHFMKQNPKGFGFWIWKPYIILQTIKNLEPGWGVAYLDAGCILNPNSNSLARLETYKEHALTHSVWATELKSKDQDDFSNSAWCKSDALTYLEANETISRMNQVQGGICMFSNDEKALKLLESWHAASIADGHHYLDDSVSKTKNAANFIEHRHDQALFSVLFRLMNLKPIPDETHFPNAWTTDGTPFPIWAARWTFSSSFRSDGKKSLEMRIETIRRLGLIKTLKIVWKKYFVRHQ
jgi:hypothetical protein